MTTTVQRIALGTEIHTLKWLGETRAGQELLAASRRANQRPRCMCVPDGVEMYVGRRGRIHYLSRMPGTGFLHADTCQSVESASLLSGIHAYAPGAIVEQSDGLVSLSLDIERLDRQEPPLTRVSIDGLLETLVEQADLNRIGPASTARTWASVRDRLGEAAGWIQVGGKPLSPLLYLPERYDKANGAASQSTCEDFIAAAQGQALLCAPLKEICWTTYSWKISLKHLPGLRLWVSKDVASELERRWRTPCFTRPPRYALCLVVAKPGRRPKPAQPFSASLTALAGANDNPFDAAICIVAPVAGLRPSRAAFAPLSASHFSQRALPFGQPRVYFMQKSVQSVGCVTGVPLRSTVTAVGRSPGCGTPMCTPRNGCAPPGWCSWAAWPR